MLDERIFCGDEESRDEFYLSGVRVESSLDPALQAQIAPLQLWDNRGKGLRAMPDANYTLLPENSLFERCGIVQRASYHNRSCQTALGSLGQQALIPQIDQGRDPATGVEILDNMDLEEMRCSVFEPWKVTTACARGTCNANGLCSRQPTAPVLRAH